MSDKTTTLKLSGYTVTLRNEPTWAGEQAVEAVFVGASAVNTSRGNTVMISEEGYYRYKMKQIEVMVEAIADNDGKEVKYSQEWVETLSKEDGKKLFEKCNEHFLDMAVAHSS